MHTVVLKQFEAEGRKLEIGEVVDSSDWRNEQKLINTRYLRPATEEEVKALPPRDRKAESKPAPAAKSKSKTKKKAA
jgi:hypothetical protein